MKTDCHDCCHPRPVDDRACGCCEGVQPLTPATTANRPGLPRIRYRIGTHASFLETMKARLSSSDFPQLAGLTTRDDDDPSLALLDGWATVADVLTFYQERIANEGYLRTATERRSILELARLVGYKLRPGVSSSVFLAYTIDENIGEETIIPAGSRAQSIPGPDELPQSFETSEDLKARAEWNNLKPRMSRPQTAHSFESANHSRIYLKGINTNLKPNDPLLIDTGAPTPGFYRVKEVEPDARTDRTRVALQPRNGNAGGQITSATSVSDEPLDVRLVKSLTRAPSLQPVNSWRLKRNLGVQFREKSDAGYRTLSSLSPLLRGTLSTAFANVKLAADSDIKVYALRVKASLFGHNAPREPQYEPSTYIPSGAEFPVSNPNAGNLKPQPWPEWKPDGESPKVLYLAGRYEQIVRDSYLVVKKETTSATSENVYQINDVELISRSAYGISGETTKITLNEAWWKPGGDISLLRTTKVYTQPEVLELAEEPIDDPIGYCPDNNTATDRVGSTVELDGFYDGLESGRWVIISGERDLPGTSGVRFSELAMVSAVTQDVQKETAAPGYPEEPRPGEKRHTFIRFAEKLSYCFKRDTVTIHGNVVKATHGETRNEVLGSGDGSKALQSFQLKQFPLTHVAAANPSGVESTLKIHVNDLQWHEADSLAGLQESDRKFVTRTDDEAKTTVIFGNGKQGARLPTGTENIRAEYRNGIGKPGNVRAEQIAMLATKPLGVKEVINPLRASGGADRESRDQARKSAPLAVMALDRLVSVRDYQDFTRLYAGIGKASAVEISNGRQQLVHVTIAGADDIPIDESSDLFINLHQALRDFGDPFQPVQLAVRELMFIVISANVQLQPDYRWEPVAARLRAALLDSFGFEQRELGQDVLLSEVISVMQAVPGVACVDVDTLGGIPEKITPEGGERRWMTPEEISRLVNCASTEWGHDNMDDYCRYETGDPACAEYAACKRYGFIGTQGRVNQRLSVNPAEREGGTIRPAQLAFLSPDVPDTLILNQSK